MEYIPGALQRHSGLLDTARKAVITLFVSGVAAAALKPEVVKFLTDPSRTVSDYLYVALLVVNVLVGASWIWITGQEFELLVAWLDPEKYSPPSGVQEWLLILGIGLLLATQILSARFPIVYGGVFAGFAAWTLIAVRHLNKELTVAIEASRKRLDAARATPGNKEEESLDAQALDVLEKYFLKRHHAVRYGCSILFGLVGMALAIAAQTRSSEVLRALSYGVFLTWFVVSESIITIWRFERDAVMRTLLAERDEVRRNAGGNGATREIRPRGLEDR